MKIPSANLALLKIKRLYNVISGIRYLPQDVIYYKILNSKKDPSCIYFKGDEDEGEYIRIPLIKKDCKYCNDIFDEVQRVSKYHTKYFQNKNPIVTVLDTGTSIGIFAYTNKQPKEFYKW